MEYIFCIDATLMKPSLKFLFVCSVSFWILLPCKINNIKNTFEQDQFNLANVYSQLKINIKIDLILVYLKF